MHETQSEATEKTLELNNRTLSSVRVETRCRFVFHIGAYVQKSQIGLARASVGQSAVDWSDRGRCAELT